MKRFLIILVCLGFLVSGCAGLQKKPVDIFEEAEEAGKKWSEYTDFGSGAVASGDTFLIRDIDDAEAHQLNQYQWQHVLADISAANLTITGNRDLGGATGFELPNVNDPVTNAEGEIAWDANDNMLEVYDGSSSKVIDTALEPFLATIMDPDVQQAIADFIPLLPIEAEFYPHGITIVDFGIKTDNSSTYSVVLEEWTDPATHANDLETVATSASTEAEDDGAIGNGSGGNPGDCNVGSIIGVDLPTTAGTQTLQIWFTFFINPGN